MGYMEVAEVVESDRQELPASALVAAAYGHRSHHVLAPTDHRVVLPPDLDPVLGIYLAQMGPIAANGLLHAAAELSRDGDPDLGAGVRGRHVLVTGAGVVGLLTGLLARRHGAATVVVADPDPDRLAAARGLGLGVLDESQQEPWRWCKETWRHGPGDRGADVVFQCRGRDSALHQALKSLRPQGTVVDLAFYQGGAAAVHLGEEFHHNGLTIRCAQINRVPRGLSPTWDRARLSAETAGMLLAEAGPLREHLVTDVVAVEQAPQVVMELVRRQRHALQIVLDFGADRP
jgi:threonine dehydrogenase-like Zn-dependent dehydrogenase